MIKKAMFVFREKNILSLTTSMVVALIGLLNFMLLTRSLEKALFGEWVLFITISTFVDMLRFGLTSNALIRFASHEDPNIREKYLGASYKIGLYAVLFCAVVLWSTLGIVDIIDMNIDGGYRMFLSYYPLLAMFNLSWNNSVSYFQALQKFEKVLSIRLSTTLPFLLFLLINYSFLNAGLMTILYVYLASNMIPSLMIFFKRWDGLLHLKSADKQSTNEMLKFGKFSMGTLIGTNLLKSADTIIIGLSPVLGSVGIALYAIPLKLTDLLSIPLRSFSIAAYPRMSLLSQKNEMESFKKLFHTYSGAITLLFIPVSCLCFLFSNELITLLGGSSYSNDMPLLQNIFGIFIIYSVLLPIDRFTGVALDSINKPKFNFYKVMIMTGANIIGNIVAVFYFVSLEYVALVTVLFTLVGIFAGYYYLNKFVEVSIKRVLLEGFSFYKNFNSQIKKLAG